ncbi:MAG: ATP-binding protein [Pirellula sp.]
MFRVLLSDAAQSDLRSNDTSRSENRSREEAAVVESLEIIPVHTLQEAVGFLNGQLDIDPVPSRLDELFATFSQYDIDFSDVRRQDMAKRALTIAAAGSHNLLMLGPPGSGETEYTTSSSSHDTTMLA